MTRMARGVLRREALGSMVEASDQRGDRWLAATTIRVRLRVPARLRNLELVLLIIACGIGTSAIILVQLGALGHIDASVIGIARALTASG